MSKLTEDPAAFRRWNRMQTVIEVGLTLLALPVVVALLMGFWPLVLIGVGVLLALVLIASRT
jgi:hypothetical protein